MFLLDFVLKKPAQELFALVHKQFGWFAAASGGEEETVDTSIGQTPSHKICIGAWDVSCMLDSDVMHYWRLKLNVLASVRARMKPG